MTGMTTAELMLFEPNGLVGAELPVGEAGTLVMERVSAIVSVYCEAKSNDGKNPKRRIVRR